MFFSQDRSKLRQMYIEAWRKFESGEPMSPLEDQIASVIALHPEYHDAMRDDFRNEDYKPEDGKTNPFLHMGLHLAIREQIGTDRPAGIRAAFNGLTKRLGDAHDAEHRMLDVLAETLWDAQRNGRPPDEAQYLERLRRL